MKDIHKIMVGCDCSDYSAETLSYAAHMAEKLEAELIIVNIINKRDIDTILKVAERQFDRAVEKYVKNTADAYVDNAKADRTQYIEQLVKDAGYDNLPFRILFRVGHPFQELIRAIEDEAADLMVVGQKGHDDLADVLFGSTADKLFRRCPVPLLSVR